MRDGDSLRHCSTLAAWHSAGQMTQPTVSQHWRTMVSQPRQEPIPPDSAHWKVKRRIEQKKFNIHIIIYTCVVPWRQETQRRLEYRELNQARSKPDTVDRPVRTAHIFVHHYNSTQYCSTETICFNIPLPPDQHHISDMTKWRSVEDKMAAYW